MNKKNQGKLKKKGMIKNIKDVPKISGRFLSEVNLHRKKQGLEALKLDKNLNKFAKWKADKLYGQPLDHGDLHTQFIKVGIKVSAPYCENLYRDSFGGKITNIKSGRLARKAISSWMKSNGHRKNLLLEDIKVAGFGRSGPYVVFVGALSTSSGILTKFSFLLVPLLILFGITIAVFISRI